MRPSAATLFKAAMGLGIAYGGYVLVTPGGTPLSAAADALALLTGAIVLTPDQRRMRDIIASTFEARGLGKWAAAATANAYAESRLNPFAAVVEKSGSSSVGLFQLNDCATCAGKGMSVSARLDPAQNASRIADELVRHGAAAVHPATEGDAAEWFAHEIERCAACGYADGSAELIRRRGYVDQLFGQGAGDKPFGTLAGVA